MEHATEAHFGVEERTLYSKSAAITSVFSIIKELSTHFFVPVFAVYATDSMSTP